MTDKETNKPDNFKLTIPAEVVEGKVYLIRERRVMMDTDVAALYRVDVKEVVEAVSTHHDRFPDDFVFQLTDAEFKKLKEQPNDFPAKTKTSPHVFTEAGIAMLACVLTSPRAVRMHLAMMRSFIQMNNVCVPKHLTVTKEDLGDLIYKLTKTLEDLEEHQDDRYEAVLEALKTVAQEEPPPERRIGFDTGS